MLYLAFSFWVTLICVPMFFHMIFIGQKRKKEKKERDGRSVICSWLSHKVFLFNNCKVLEPKS